MAELKQDKLSMQQLAKKFGIAASYLSTDKTLQAVLKKIINQNITDPERMQAMIQNTGWWKNYSNEYRQYEYVKQTHPAEFAVNLQNAKESVLKQAQALGITIDDATAEEWADLLLRGSSKMKADGSVVTYDDAWLGQQLAAAIDFTKTKTVGGIQILDIGGSIGTAVDDIYEMARDYGIDTTMANSSFNSWMQSSITGLVSGDSTEADIKQGIMEMAMANFPGFADQIRQGYTLRDAAASQLSAIATELELDVNTIDLNDNIVQKVLNSQAKPMTAYEARKAARADSRWQFTENARNEYQSIGTKILEDFGFGV